MQTVQLDHTPCCGQEVVVDIESGKVRFGKLDSLSNQPRLGCSRCNPPKLPRPYKEEHNTFHYTTPDGTEHEWTGTIITDGHGNEWGAEYISVPDPGQPDCFIELLFDYSLNSDYEFEDRLYDLMEEAILIDVLGYWKPEHPVYSALNQLASSD